MLLRLGCRRHPLAFLQIAQRGHPNLHPSAVMLNPRQPLAVRRNRYLANLAPAVQPIQNRLYSSPILSGTRSRSRNLRPGTGTNEAKASEQRGAGNQPRAKGFAKNRQKHTKMLTERIKII